MTTSKPKTSPPPQFSLPLGIAARDAGMQDAAYGYGGQEWLAQARVVAEHLAAIFCEPISIDDVLLKCPRPQSVSPNVTGSLFKTKKWKCVGYAPSTQVQRHAGVVRLWALR